MAREGAVKVAPNITPSNFREWTPSDTDDLPEGVIGIHVGGDGNLELLGLDGRQATLEGLVAGQQVACRPKRILSAGSGTTATALVLLIA